MERITMAKSLQTEFVKYYTEKLAPMGFKKVKGRHPYFVRVVNDEILHIFTFMGTNSMEYGYKAFHLMCGVATVYRKEINFSVATSNNSDWMVVLGDMYEKAETEFPVVELPRKSMIFYYNDENMNEVLEETYSGAKVMINEMDKAGNMDEVLRYVLKYYPCDISFLSLLKEDFCDEEGLFYARKEYDCTKIEKVFENKFMELKNSGLSDSEKRESYTELTEWKERITKRRSDFLSNDADYEMGIKLLKKHYDTNVDKLIGYGLDIKKKELEF